MNNTFHAKFPFGKGCWLWELWACVGKNNISLVTEDDIKNIAQVCKDNNLSYVIIKSGDRLDTWLQWEQFSQIILKSFHALGIKVYTWTYCYGDVPLREAAIAMWSLDKGSDGHVFDAESEYQGKPESAKTMLQAVREHAPDAFLAYAPFPIIDYHLDFPYIEFGKYCNAVMPQMYFGDFELTPLDTINWTIQQFTKWHEVWKTEYPDSIQPIIPLGQAYDNPKTNYEQNGKDIAEFITGSKEYLSVNFWSFQHMYKTEVWNAIKDTEIAGPPLENPQKADSQTASQDNTNTQPAISSTPAPSVPVPSTPEQTTKDNTNTPEPTSPKEEKTPVKGSDIVGINSGNGVHLPQARKKHIDYAREFILSLLRLFRIYI